MEEATTVTLDLSSLDEPLRTELRDRLREFGANLTPELAALTSTEVAYALQQEARRLRG